MKIKCSIYGIIFSIFGFLFQYVTFYPGFMSFDSISQFESSKSLNFNDWQAPMLPWLWSIINVFSDGPQGMLFVNLLLLWIGLYMIFINYLDKKYSYLILFIGLLPWVINFSGVLWKDTSMAFALLVLVGIGLLEKSPTKTFISLLLIFYIFNLRYNSIFAIVPISIWLIQKWYTPISKTKLFLTLVILFGGLMIISNWFNYTILNAKKSYPTSYIMVDDLTYLSARNNIAYIPDLNINDIQECANKEIGQTKLVGKAFCFKNKLKTLNYQTNYRLTSIWLKQIRENFFSYLSYRISAFLYLIRSPNDTPFLVWYPGVDPNDLGIKQSKSGATVLVEKLVYQSSNLLPFIFKPYWWLLISIIVLLFTFILVKNNLITLVQTLLVSSILYILGYIPITEMADFRYVYWSVISTSLAFILLIINKDDILFTRDNKD